ncbi:hypothetical protein BGW38_003069 [Lunasporangiospora selenospora]|uniref:Uncharacterized protein n=1 Tax=Lunasporangiospora selenospora TaxID=979761 RepID=A0A9P6KCY8_9FUNG|nr:hypothetical protein BGW38_003069 [Lunasporangiospora selenospora]
MTLDSDESARAAAGGGGPGSGSGLGLRKTKSWNLQSRDQDVHRRLEYEAQDAHQSGSMEYGPQHSYPQLRTFFAPIEKREPPALNHSPQQHHRYPQHQPPQQQQQQQQQRQHPAHDYPPSHYQSSGPGYGYQGHPSHPEAGLKGAPGSQHGDPRNMPRYSREPEGGDVDWSASGAAAGGDEAESRRKRTRVYDRDSAGYYQQDPNLLERDPRPPAGYPGGQGPGQGSHGSMPSGRSPLPMSPSLRAKAPLQPLAPQPAPLQHPRDASGGPPHGGSTPSDMRMARREYDRPEYDYDPGRYRPHGGEPPQDSYGHSWRESAHHERGREMAEGRRVHQDLLGGPAPPPPPPPPSQPSSQPSGHSPYSHTTQPPMPPYTSRPYPPPHHGARQQNSNPNPPPASTTPQQQQQKPHDDRQPADPAAIAPSLSTPTSGYDHPQRYDRDRDYGYDQGPR